MKRIPFFAGMILCGAGALVGALMGQPIIFAFAFFALVVIMIVAGNRITQENRQETYEDELSPESRTLLRPIRKLHQELAQFVSSSDQSEIRVIGAEALHESRTIVQHCVKLLQLRSEVRRSLQGKYAAETSLSELRASLESASGESERASLQTAMEAREKEMAHYAEQEAALGNIEGQLRQAEAALSELKARLMLSASTGDEAANSDELSGTLARLRSLSGSLDEAEELLRGETR
ncbi:MAG TPA: hypothetical protein VEX38_10195 [Fimbriimonadaceae bacterium]|nr:hypothetical protein [Fimbriimonadaceae bacterium]